MLLKTVHLCNINTQRMGLTHYKWCGHKNCRCSLFGSSKLSQATGKARGKPILTVALRNAQGIQRWICWKKAGTNTHNQKAIQYELRHCTRRQECKQRKHCSNAEMQNTLATPGWHKQNSTNAIVHAEQHHTRFKQCNNVPCTN